MVQLSAAAIRYLSDEEFRVLTAIEMGMKNHQFVASELVAAIANIRSGGVHKYLKALVQKNFVLFEKKAKKNGYSLNYSGYDALALRVLLSRGVITSIGNQIGVGKESDVYIASDDTGATFCLKLHRLGRTSFRQLKNKRDYHQNRKAMSWLYLSRISATREFTYLQALYDKKYPVPKPIDHNRHAIVMELLDAINMTDCHDLDNPEKTYNTCMDCIRRLAQDGVVHGDFNEFNLMLDKNQDVRVIDLPQLISFKHPEAREYFERDVDCVRNYFSKKYKYQSLYYPSYEEIEHTGNMDATVNASGYKTIISNSSDIEQETLEIDETVNLNDEIKMMENLKVEINDNLIKLPIKTPIVEIIDPEEKKNCANRKVMSQIQKKKDIEKRRRARKHGEAGLATKNRRENKYIISSDSYR